jgi:hypothetical protein
MLGTQILPLYHNTPWSSSVKLGDFSFLGIALYLLGLLAFHLTFPCILEYCKIYFHLHDFYISDNPKVELVELFAQLGWHLLYSQLTQMSHSTPNVGYHICFPRVVVDSKIIILNKL